MTDWTTARVTPETLAELRRRTDHEWHPGNRKEHTMTEMTPLYIDPRTVPAEPEDPRVELLAEDLEASGQCCFDIWPCDRADEWRNDARNILARLDAAGGRIVTPEKLAELRRLLDAPPQHITIVRDDALALLDAAAERDRLARLLDEPRRSGCAVEIAGVRIAPCDERGQTADMLAADRLRRELAYMAEARDNARAEVERLSAQLDAVRALHGPRVVQVLGPVCSAEECDHEDACPLVDYTVCGHCYDVGDGAHPYAYEEGGLQDVAHPCATYRALDESEANK